MIENRIKQTAQGAIAFVAAAIVVTGCQSTKPAVPAPTPALAPATQVSAVTPPPAQPAPNFQPCTFVPKPCPCRVVTKPKHRRLYFMERENHGYLADTDGNVYDAGRDSQGNLYPVYQDQATDTSYPLYYDQRSDNYYRVCENADGDYYRNYEGEPENTYYESDPGEETQFCDDSARPDIVNYWSSGNDYDNDSEDYEPPYAGYDEYYHPYHHEYGNGWLAVLPIVVAAFVEFEPQGSSNYYDNYYYGSDHRIDQRRYNQNNYVNVYVNNEYQQGYVSCAPVPGPPIFRSGWQHRQRITGARGYRDTSLVAYDRTFTNHQAHPGYRPIITAQPRPFANVGTDQQRPGDGSFNRNVVFNRAPTTGFHGKARRPAVPPTTDEIVEHQAQLLRAQRDAVHNQLHMRNAAMAHGQKVIARNNNLSRLRQTHMAQTEARQVSTRTVAAHNHQVRQNHVVPIAQTRHTQIMHAVHGVRTASAIHGRQQAHVRTGHVIRTRPHQIAARFVRSRTTNIRLVQAVRRPVRQLNESYNRPRVERRLTQRPTSYIQQRPPVVQRPRYQQPRRAQTFHENVQRSAPRQFHPAPSKPQPQKGGGGRPGGGGHDQHGRR